MGWTTGNWPTRKSMIEHRLNDRNWVTQDGTRIEAAPLHHCYRGNPYSGVLWIVWEWKRFRNDIQISTERWIECDLLRYYKSDNSWGYKDMEESMHPYYYSCPVKYLDITLPRCQQWRKNVRDYNQQINQKRQKTREKNKRYRQAIQTGLIPAPALS